MKNLKELQNLLKFFDIKENKRTIFASDLNIIFNIKESLNISNILNIRNRKSQNFAFR